MGKTSNNPEKSRQFKLTSNLIRGGRVSKVSESEQFAGICRMAAHLAKEYGRARALEYLQWHGPWLRYYLGGTGPSSGRLLDEIIKNK